MAGIAMTVKILAPEQFLTWCDPSPLCVSHAEIIDLRTKAVATLFLPISVEFETAEYTMHDDADIPVRLINE